MNKLKITKHIIIYFDILGYQERIKENQNLFLHEIDNIINVTFNNIDLLNCYFKDINYKVFSDNFIITLPLKNNLILDLENLSALSFIIGIIENLFIETFQIFIRGCIHIGDLLINNNYVFGSGLVEAYNYENQQAIYPRIIISKEVLDYINYENYTSNLTIDKLKGLINTDTIARNVSPDIITSLNNLIKNKNAESLIAKIFSNNEIEFLICYVLSIVKEKIQNFKDFCLTTSGDDLYFINNLSWSKDKIKIIYENANENRKSASTQRIKEKYDWFVNYAEQVFNEQQVIK